MEHPFKVTIKTSPITMRGDTIEINASRFKVLPGSDVAQLFKKIPGFQVDVKGKVLVNGKEIKKITVDGSEFFGNNPALVSKTLQADMIDKVQVFEEKDRQGNIIEDGEVTINLNLKKGANNGYFGDAILGAGTNELFEAGLRLNSFKEDRKLSLIANGNNTNNSGFDFGFNSWHGWVNNNRMGQGWAGNNAWTNGAYNLASDGNINNRADYGFSYFNEVANKKKVSGNVVYKTNYSNSENSSVTENVVSDTLLRKSENQNTTSGGSELVSYKVAYSDWSDSMKGFEVVFKGGSENKLLRENQTNLISLNDRITNDGRTIGLASQNKNENIVNLDLWRRLSKKQNQSSVYVQLMAGMDEEKTDIHRYNIAQTDSFNIYNHCCPIKK